MNSSFFDDTELNFFSFSLLLSWRLDSRWVEKSIFILCWAQWRWKTFFTATQSQLNPSRRIKNSWNCSQEILHTSIFNVNKVWLMSSIWSEKVSNIKKRIYVSATGVEKKCGIMIWGLNNLLEQEQSSHRSELNWFRRSLLARGHHELFTFFSSSYGSRSLLAFTACLMVF